MNATILLIRDDGAGDPDPNGTLQHWIIGLDDAMAPFPVMDQRAVADPDWPEACGETCCAMVSTWLGRPVPIVQVIADMRAYGGEPGVHGGTTSNYLLRWLHDHGISSTWEIPELEEWVTYANPWGGQRVVYDPAVVGAALLGRIAILSHPVVDPLEVIAG